MHQDPRHPLADLLPRPLRTAGILAIVAAALAAAGATGQWLRYRRGFDSNFWFVRQFDLDREGNVSTWYSASLLLAACLLLAALARLKPAGPHPRHWAWLAAVFALLSVDEAASLHETLIDPLRRTLNAGGVLYYTWVIPGAAFALAVLAASISLLRRLPPRTRWLFLIAGAVFVGGAVGVEMIGAAYEAAHGYDNLRYKAIAYVEEAMEMAGVILFIFALLDYLHRHAGRARPGIIGRDLLVAP